MELAPVERRDHYWPQTYRALATPAECEGSPTAYTLWLSWRGDRSIFTQLRNALSGSPRVSLLTRTTGILPYRLRYVSERIGGVDLSKLWYFVATRFYWRYPTGSL